MEILHLLVHFPKAHKGQVWARMKAGARSFIFVSHVGAGVQGPGPFSTQRQVLCCLRFTDEGMNAI